jgi:hypothetical protein
VRSGDEPLRPAIGVPRAWSGRFVPAIASVSLGHSHEKEERTMTLQIELIPIISIVAGIAILIVPRLLNYIVAIYLIVIGVVGLLNL